MCYPKGMNVNLPLVSNRLEYLKIPIEAPQKHPVSTEHKEVKRVEDTISLVTTENTYNDITEVSRMLGVLGHYSAHTEHF